MNVKYATVFGLLGMAIAIVMGLISMANNFIYAQANPGADMSDGYKALLASAIAVASWVAPVRLGRRIGGLALVAAAVCSVVQRGAGNAAGGSAVPGGGRPAAAHGACR